MNWQQAVEKTVTGLGYELVDCELASRGLLCVYIDRVPGCAYGEVGPADPAGPQVQDNGIGEQSRDVVAMDPGVGSVTVDDCERVTRQLQYVLEVEGVSYTRLEVSSPGVDRPLRRVADFERFSGETIDVTLKVIFQGRKKYRGVLRAAAEAGRYELVFNDGKEDQVLGFELAEVREARLVPELDFKGRRQGLRKASGPAAADVKRARSKRANAKAKQNGPGSGGHEE